MRLVAVGKNITTIFDVGTAREPLYKIEITLDRAIYESFTKDLSHASEFQFDVEWHYEAWQQAQRYAFSVEHYDNRVRLSFANQRRDAARKSLVDFIEKNAETAEIEQPYMHSRPSNGY